MKAENSKLREQAEDHEEDRAFMEEAEEKLQKIQAESISLQSKLAEAEGHERSDDNTSGEPKMELVEFGGLFFWINRGY